MAAAVAAERTGSQFVFALGLLHPLPEPAVSFLWNEARVVHLRRPRAHAAFNSAGSRCSARSRSAMARPITSG
jgi:hypothetical protein